MLVAAVVSTAAASNPPRQAQLRVRAQALDTRTHKALLDLYAIDSRLGTAQTRLAALARESLRLQTAQRSLAQEVAATRRTVTVSQQLLAEHLRALYEQGDVDPLAVVLGAESLDDALARLDDLKRATDQSRQIAVATRTAQVRLVRLQKTLAGRRADVDAALADARATAAAVAAARADRVAYVGRLRREKQLASAQITALETTAQRVQVKSQSIQQSAAPPAPAGDTTTTATTAPTTAPSQGHTLTVSATGYSLPGHTATGLPVGWGIVAVDPSVIPLGTRLTVPGYGEAVAADVGSGVHGAMIDLWFPTLAQARAWGRRTVTITLH